MSHLAVLRTVEKPGVHIQETGFQTKEQIHAHLHGAATPEGGNFRIRLGAALEGVDLDAARVPGAGAGIAFGRAARAVV